MSINIVRNIEDTWGFGWIGASGVTASSVIVTERKGILKYKQISKMPFGCCLEVQFHVVVMAF